jgi:thymidylate synthase (FAD)
MNPKVTLLSWPPYCRELLFSIWHVAHSGSSVPLPEEIARKCQVDEALDKEVEETFQKIVLNEIPVSENAWFVFLLENITISLRDQICRHRIGSKLGDSAVIDVIPNVADSTQWVRGSRIEPMKAFADEGRYRTPDTVKENGKSQAFHEAMKVAQDTYNALLAAGVPIEEAREILPLGVHNRMTWGLNLTALRHICARRTCWISQATLWHPIIHGMTAELAAKVHPMFRTLADPPCFNKNGEWKGCAFHLENGERLRGADPLVPCSLYVHKHSKETGDALRTRISDRWDLVAGDISSASQRYNETYAQMKRRFSELWQRDSKTGEAFAKDDLDENHGTTPETI